MHSHKGKRASHNARCSGDRNGKFNLVNKVNCKNHSVSGSGDLKVTSNNAVTNRGSISPSCSAALQSQFPHINYICATKATDYFFWSSSSFNSTKTSSSSNSIPSATSRNSSPFYYGERYFPNSNTLVRDLVLIVDKQAFIDKLNTSKFKCKERQEKIHRHQKKNMSYPAKYEPVAEAIRKIIPQEGYDDGSCGPILVRLAWHASGTYDKASGTGGSNGATMRYEMEAKDSANNGLEHARKFLEPIKQQFPWMTYADLWTFAGVVAVEYMDGPKIEWQPGRVDYLDEKNVPPNGRLPDGAQGQDHLRQIFYRMGFNDQEIVALCGAHNLGRTHADRSGFDGPWVPNPTKFSNTYFKLLLHEEWHLSNSPAGLPQYYDEDKELMMLPADYSLIVDPEFKKWVEKYAEDKDLFFADFAKVFAKLIELGVRRGSDGLAKVNEIGKINGVENKL